jgi:hypothetical protein
MVAENREHRSLPFSSKHVQAVDDPTEPARQYLGGPRDLSREMSSPGAGRRDKENGRWQDRLDRLSLMPAGSTYKPPLTEEDICAHAWLNERLAALHRERNGLWSKIRWFFLRY